MDQQSQTRVGQPVLPITVEQGQPRDIDPFDDGMDWEQYVEDEVRQDPIKINYDYLT